MSYPDSALTSVDTASMRSGASALMSTDSTIISGRKGSSSRTPTTGKSSPSRSIAGTASGPKQGNEKIDKGDDCLYIARDKSLIVAKCTKVDRTIDPPGYEIYILNRDAYVETERHRLLTVNEAVVYREQQSRDAEDEKLAVASKLARRKERSEMVEEEATVHDEVSLQAYESQTRRKSAQRGSVQDSVEQGISRGTTRGDGEERRHRRHHDGGEGKPERAHREHHRERERNMHSPEGRREHEGRHDHEQRRHREHADHSSHHHHRDRDGERVRRDPARDRHH